MTKAIQQLEIASTRSLAAQETLSSAVLEAATILAVSQSELSDILGISPASVSRMASGSYLLQRERKEWQLAALFVRMFRSLDSITGGSDALSQSWLRSPNQALHGTPGAMLAEIDSFVRVVQYLDASRARV